MGATTESMEDPSSYALGYSQSEFRRLERQSAFFGDLTEDLLRRAGVSPGMRVLDLGCGVGDVSMLAARLVGPSGLVVGIDRSVEAIGTARKRAASGACTWTRFIDAELDAFVSDEPFDAVIGRFVLMYLPDPAATLRRLSAHLRPNGLIAFQEMAMPLARSTPEGPHFRQCAEWIMTAFARAGVERDMGGKLLATFLAAGLPTPQMILGGRVEGGPDSPIYDYFTDVLRSLLPLIERVGLATAAEVQIDGMAERLRREATAHNACIMPPPLVGAWARMAA